MPDETIHTAPEPAAANVPFGSGSVEPHHPRRWLAIIFLLAALPLVYQLGRHELAQWYVAAATEAELCGDLPKAIRCIDRAIRWEPTNIEVLQHKVGLLLQSGNAVDALPICDTMVAIARKQRDRSFADTDQFAYLLAETLNTSAYSYALAKSDLNKAFEQINEACEILRDQMPLEIRDTRAYIYFLQGKYEDALVDADGVLRNFEEFKYPALRRELAWSMQMIIDRRRIKQSSHKIQSEHAVYCQHRGLIHEALGNREKALADLSRAKELGFDPSRGVW